MNSVQENLIHVAAKALISRHQITAARCVRCRRSLVPGLCAEFLNRRLVSGLAAAEEDGSSVHRSAYACQLGLRSPWPSPAIPAPSRVLDKIPRYRRLDLFAVRIRLSYLVAPTPYELDPDGSLRYVLKGIAEHPISHIDELLPRDVVTRIPLLYSWHNQGQCPGRCFRWNVPGVDFRFS